MKLNDPKICNFNLFIGHNLSNSWKKWIPREIEDSKLGIKKYFLNYIGMITMLNRQLLRCIKPWRWGIKWNLVYYFFSASLYKKACILFFALHPVTPVTSGCFNHLRWYFGSNKDQVLYNQQVPRGKKQKKKLCCYKMCLQVFFCCCCGYQALRKNIGSA